MTENQKKMMEACNSSDPCKTHGGTVSGCAPGLTSIGEGGHKLNPDAAKAYIEMIKAAEKDGVKWGITDSYRPLSIQCKILDWDHFSSTGKKRKKGTGGVPVAFPGNSNNGWGSALDLKVKKGDNAYNWLVCNSRKFGYSNPFIKYNSDDCEQLKQQSPVEPWHWEHLESSKRLKSGMQSFDSGPQVATSGSTDGSSSGSSGETTNKKVSMFDLMGGGALNSWLDTFMPMKKKGTENQIPDNEDDKEKQTQVNENIDRIKNLIKKVL